jgi:3-oxoadipate enol-lactonase
LYRNRNSGTFLLNAPPDRAMKAAQPVLPLSFIDAGDLAAPALLLLHGLGSCAEDWRPQIEHFAATHRVLAIDLRGHGRSQKLGPAQSVQQMAEDVARLVRQLDLGPAHCVGLSMGGMVGLQCALSAPSLLRSLVVVNSTPHAQPDSWSLRAAYAARLLMVRCLGLPRTARVVARRLFPKPDQHALRQRFVERVAANDKTAYLAALSAIRRWSVRAELARIALPVLVLSGDRDYTTVTQKQAWVQAIPRARLEVISDSGHATPLDQPQQFNQALARFLRSIQ